MKTLGAFTGVVLLGAILSGDPIEVGFARLASFEYREGMELPAEVTELHGKKVRISGFMQAEDDGTGEVESFLLINDACGCQGTPKLNEIVFCEMPEGESTRILPGVVTVEGTLYVGEEKEDGVVLGIYFLDVEKVE